MDRFWHSLNRIEEASLQTVGGQLAGAIAPALALFPKGHYLNWIAGIGENVPD